MATLDLARSVLSPLLGRLAFIPHSGPASFLSGYLYEDAPLDDEVLTPTDTLGGFLQITELLTDTASLSDVLSGDYLVTMTDSAPMTDSLGIPDFAASPLIESLTLTDTLGVPVFETIFKETLTTTDTLGGALAITSGFTDALVATDTLSMALTGVFTETLTPTDALLAVETPLAFSDSVEMTDTLSGVLSITDSLADALSPTDILTSLDIVALTETLTWADTLTGPIAGFAPLTDTLSVSDTLTGIVALYGSLTDTATITETLDGSLVLLGVFTETLAAGDTLVQTQSQTVLAINAETGAVSEYVFTPTIQGLGAWQGQLYIATDEGLYALDHTTDDSLPIEWEFRTGFANLGSDLLKRVLDVNVMARGDGTALLLLTAGRLGTKEEYHYESVTLPLEALRGQVMKAGKGVKSVYWQVGCQGTGPAEIDEIRVRTELLSRRY